MNCPSATILNATTRIRGSDHTIPFSGARVAADGSGACTFWSERGSN